jgi:hypothetical protein
LEFASFAGIVRLACITMSMESGLALALYLSAAAALLPLAFFLSHWRRERMPGGHGWRLRLVVAGRWAYEERVGRNWVGIPFEEPVESRDPPYVVVAPSEDTWRTFPAWAHERRAEIIGRVQFALSGRNYVVKVPARAPDPAFSPAPRRAGYSP